MYRHLNTLSFMVYLHFNIASFRGIIPIFSLTGQSCPTLLYTVGENVDFQPLRDNISRTVSNTATVTVINRKSHNVDLL